MAVLARHSDQHLFLLLLSSQQLVIAVVLLLLASGGPSPAAASRDVLQRICSNLDEQKDTCLRILLPQPWAVSCGDEKCVAGNMIPRLAQPQATTAHDLAQKHADDPSEGDLLEAFTKCVSSYNGVLGKLREALAAFNRGSYLEAMTQVTGAEDDIDACDNGFERKPSPMTGANRSARDTVSVLLTILDLLAA